jgi:hypothetical protein
MVAPICVDKGPRRFGPNGKLLFVLTTCWVLWDPVNLVALELLCRTIPPCFEVVCWKENKAARDDSRVGLRWESRLHLGSRDPIST